MNLNWQVNDFEARYRYICLEFQCPGTEVGGSWDGGQSELCTETSLLTTEYIRNLVTLKYSKQQQQQNKNMCYLKQNKDHTVP